MTIITDQHKLREHSRETSLEEINDIALISQLKEACKSAWTVGLGLTAIQIGIPLRAAWLIIANQETILINPKIIRITNRGKYIKEGCLSIPYKWTSVKRAFKIRYLNDEKIYTAKGLKAQIIQHEIDHMNGILNIDRLKHTKHKDLLPTKAKKTT